jgi:cytochrome c
LAVRPILVLLLLLAVRPALAADGRTLFADQCASCHSLAGASGPDGPSLKGIVWRKVAARSDFVYSGALKSLGGSWSPSRLDEFLKDTQGFAPGTGMNFVVDSPQDRAALIAYLRTAR